VEQKNALKAETAVVVVEVIPATEEDVPEGTTEDTAKLEATEGAAKEPVAKAATGVVARVVIKAAAKEAIKGVLQKETLPMVRNAKVVTEDVRKAVPVRRNVVMEPNLTPEAKNVAIQIKTKATPEIKTRTDSKRKNINLSY
jgi:hypothetical protein